MRWHEPCCVADARPAAGVHGCCFLAVSAPFFGTLSAAWTLCVWLVMKTEQEEKRNADGSLCSVSRCARQGAYTQRKEEVDTPRWRGVRVPAAAHESINLAEKLRCFLCESAKPLPFAPVTFSSTHDCCSASPPQCEGGKKNKETLGQALRGHSALSCRQRFLALCRRRRYHRLCSRVVS